MSLSPSDNPVIPGDTSVVYSLQGTGGKYHLWKGFDIGKVAQPKDTFYENGRYDNWATGARAPLPPKTIYDQNQGSIQDDQLFRIQTILYQAYRTFRGASHKPEGTYMCARVTMLSGPHAGKSGFIWLIYNDKIIFEIYTPACAIEAYQHTEITLTCESQQDPVIAAHTCTHKPYALAEAVGHVCWHMPAASGPGQLAGNRRVYHELKHAWEIVGVAARDEVHARLELDIEAPPPSDDKQPVAKVLLCDARNSTAGGHAIVLPIAQSDDQSHYEAKVTARDFQDMLKGPAPVFAVAHTYEDDAYSAIAKLDDKEVPQPVEALFEDEGLPLSNKRLLKKLLPEGDTQRWLLVDKKHKRRFDIEIEKLVEGSQKTEQISVSMHAARLGHTFVRATVEPALTAEGSELKSENLAYPLLQHAVYFLPDAFGSSLFIDKSGGIGEAYPRGLKPLTAEQFDELVADNEDDVKDYVEDWYDLGKKEFRDWLIDELGDLLKGVVLASATFLVDKVLLPWADGIAKDIGDWAEDKWEQVKARIRAVLRTHDLEDLACLSSGMPAHEAQEQRLKLIRSAHLRVLDIPNYRGLEERVRQQEFPPVFFDSAAKKQPVEHTVLSDIPYDWRLPSDHGAPDIASKFRFLQDAACAIQRAHTLAQFELFRVNLGSSYLLDPWDEHLLFSALKDLQAGKLPGILASGFEHSGISGISDETPVNNVTGTSAGPWTLDKSGQSYEITLDRFRFQVSLLAGGNRRRLRYPFLARRPAIVAHGMGGVILRGLVSLDNPLRHRIGHAFFLDAELWGSPRGMLGFLTGDMFDNILSVPVYRRAWQQVALTWPASYYMWPDESHEQLVGESWPMPGASEMSALGMKGYQEKLKELALEYRTMCENANPLVQVPTYVFHTDGLRTAIDVRPDKSVAELKKWFKDRKDDLGNPFIGFLSFVIDWITGIDIVDVLDDALETAGNVTTIFDMQRLPIHAPLGDGARTTVTQIADVGEWPNAVVMRPTPKSPSHDDAPRSKWIWQRIGKVLSRAPLAFVPPGGKVLDPKPTAYDALVWPASSDQQALLAKLKEYILSFAREQWNAASSGNRAISTFSKFNDADVIVKIHGSSSDGLDNSVIHIECTEGVIEVETLLRPAEFGGDETKMAKVTLEVNREWLTGMAKSAYEWTDKVFKLRISPAVSSSYVVEFRSWED